YDLAQIASKHIGFNHHTLIPPKVISLDDLVDMIIACETPNHVWGPINQYLLLRYIHADHGLHVLLDGQGADEVFSGYAWFFPAIKEHVFQTYGAEEASLLNAAHFSKPPFSLPVLTSFHQTFFSRRKWIEASDGGALASLGLSLEELLGYEPVNYYLNDKLDWPSFRRQEFYRRELQYLLRQEDRLAMWFSIESRVPFLDHTFVDRAGMISPTFLVRDGYLKYPLRILFPELPYEVRFNVPKRGFWEEYAILPNFEEISRLALKQSKGLSKLIRHPEMVDKLSTQALWRFFQIAVLLEAGTRDEGKAWLHNLRRNLPRRTLAVYPWIERMRRRAESVLKRLA
ncbi:MAG: asparagine synthase-related protein, partial [Vitreimonas sp.]